MAELLQNRQVVILSGRNWPKRSIGANFFVRPNVYVELVVLSVFQGGGMISDYPMADDFIIQTPPDTTHEAMLRAAECLHIIHKKTVTVIGHRGETVPLQINTNQDELADYVLAAINAYWQMEEVFFERPDV